MIERNTPPQELMNLRERRNKFGLLLRRFRLETKWSQEMLAEKMKCAGWPLDHASITRIESGKRTLLDTELQFLLDIFGKSWADLSSECVEPKLCPEPQGEKLNQYGELIRSLRTEKKWSQEKLAAKLQVAGWDIDPSLVTLIENGRRPLFDYELKFLLDALGKKLD